MPDAQDRKTKLEAFHVPTARDTQSAMPDEVAVAKAPAPPSARKMPPGTPFNIKPGAALPIERMVKLGAQQYRARRGAKPGDQRAQVMAELAPGESEPILPEMPGEDKTAYTSAPPEMEIEGRDGGGEVMSDLEAMRHMKLEQQKARQAQRMAVGQETGIPGMEEEIEVLEEETAPPEEIGEEEVEEEAEEVAEEEEVDLAELQESVGLQNLAARTMQSQVQAARAELARRAASTTASAQAASVKQKEKTMQNAWRVLNGAEGLSFWGVLLFLITANLQMINTHTFQVKWIPKTEPVEDLAYLSMDIMILFAIFLICVLAVEIVAYVASALLKFANLLF